ncbi:hypothetical protein KKF05_05985 [Patescibacteria group bacterium]|nr:hypothetical protein [Patescibacteria group bacterium]MBU1028828.1 hypothetical protein [Patescibacteria group bacterium]MBU1916043.1 hypothetical protein [Patescibacteria group bacterium]
MSRSAFPKFRNAVGNLKRFRTVVTVLFEEGFSYLIDEMNLRYLVPFRARFFFSLKKKAWASGQVVGVKIIETPPEVRLRRTMERLGPTFMKLGQLLSVRSDILPPEYTREFSKLQDKGPIMNPGVAEKIIETELGMPIENIFASFDEQPIAAASLAQVHRATLRDGTPVAVKVRRLGIEEIVQTDIHILAYLAQLFAKHFPVSRRFRPVRLVREFADWTLREIDFEIEGAHTDMFRESFARLPEVVVPKVYWEFSSRSVLVTDFLSGFKVDDLAALDQQKVDRHELARIGLRIGLRMFLVDGFFHADPHPGNLVVLPATPSSSVRGKEIIGQPLRLGLYDFGQVGRLTDRIRIELISCFMSFIERKEEIYIKHILDVSEQEEDADVQSFRSQVQTILVSVMHKPTEKKGLASAFYQVLLAGAQYGILFPAELILLAKSFLTIERNGLRLWPDINLEEELRPLMAEVVKEELNPARLVADLKTTAFDNLYLLRHLPEQTQTLLERLNRGEIGVKLNLQELRDLKKEFDRQNDVRVLALLAVALLISSAVVLRLDIKASAFGISLGSLGFMVASVVVLWLFFLIKRRP